MAKKKKSRKIFWIILLLIIVIGVLLGISYFKANRDDIVTVQTTVVERRTITQKVSAIGKIQPETEVKITSETPGEIIYLGVEEGDTVMLNQLLVRINPDIVETQLDQMQAAADASKMDIDIAKATLTRNKATLERITKLYQQEFASQDEFDAAKAAYDQAQGSYNAALKRYEQALASLKQMKRNAERTTIYAPIPGVVTKLNVEQGEKVVGTAQMAGTEMMIISDLSEMNAVVEVDENDIVLVNVGDTTRIEIDAFPDRIFKGLVKEIGHSAIVNALGTQDQVTNFEVKIRLIDLDPKLRPGMSCSVDIETETRENVLAVPLQAVTVRETKKDQSPDVNEKAMGVREKDENIRKEPKDKPQSVVFLNDKNKASKVDVETGISDKGFIEITEGLEEDDEVISGSFMIVSKVLEDGTEVKVDSTRKFKGF